MVIKYLYVEDAEENQIMPFVDAVSRSQKIEIELVHPSKYADFNILAADLKHYQGIILDWRLDEIVNVDTGQSYPFRAGALAQELRSRASEGLISPLPIVLWSATQKFNASFKKDYAAQDLFDRKYTKEEISERSEEIALQLAALAEGYITIRRSQQRGIRLATLLKCSKHPEFLDIRVIERFAENSLSVYEIAHFILYELLDRPGLLINEELLAARLGINLTTSAGWERLKQVLEVYRYQGPFSIAWPRWWTYGVEEKWWFTILKAKTPLSALSATQRVAHIAEATKITDLTPAVPVQKEYHDRFYTICEETRQPLDPIDGVIIDEPQPEPWQVRRYISLDVASKHKSENYRPHPTERERLQFLTGFKHGKKEK
jgi:hypothetical protein